MASRETTRLLSAHLRTEARKSGWSEDVVSSMNVTYGKDGFTSNVSKKHFDKARDFEYGTPNTSLRLPFVVLTTAPQKQSTSL